MTMASVTTSETSVSSTSAGATITSSTSDTSISAGPSRASGLKFPVRIGIMWRKGEKLEAMDFSRTWYPSKIVEIDEAAKCVLIHFEGWNQRYDEWVPMDSEKLRPVTRHSERKDKGTKKRRIHPHPIYRPGEQVMAKWTDCKKYPAKISRLMEDGMYEVIFYDGVSRLIQPMNIQPMPEEMKNMKNLSMKTPPTPKNKLSFKHIKLTLPESVRRKKELAMETGKLSGFSSVLVKKNKSPKKFSSTITKTMPKVKLGRDPSLGKLGARKTKFPSLKVKPFKKSLALEEVSASDRTEEATDPSPAQTASLATAAASSPLPSLTSSSTPPPPSSSSAVGEEAALIAISSSVAAEKTSAGLENVEGSGTSQTQMTSAVAINQEQEGDATVESPVLGPIKIPGSQRKKKRRSTDPLIHPTKRRKVKVKPGVDKVRVQTKQPSTNVAGKSPKTVDSVASLGTPPPSALLPPQVFIPSKAFIVEEDHNPFKCPHEGCNKDFRKESLLAYHIKYYHIEPETPPAATVAATTDAAVGVTSPLFPPSCAQCPIGTATFRKRRKKTSSICSTDSDISISSKGKSSKRHCHDSEISLAAASPDLPDLKTTRLSQDTEDAIAADTEDEDVEADVVNCVCGQRETNGLMIQCDVCMCWQHFACVDSKNSGEPPANYVCSICENTPGVRDSCRFLYDMGWERRGELPSFPFITQSSLAHLKSLACECNSLIAAVQGIKSALHSTRRQLKISKDEADPEFQLWQTDWDNWTKPEEDLTLTPRSADPEPSPTPSTFLFPSSSNPGSTPATNTTSSAVVSPSSVSVPSHCSPSCPTPITRTTTIIEIASTVESPAQSSQPSTIQLDHRANSSNISPPSGSLLEERFLLASKTTPCILSKTCSVSQGGNLPSLQNQTSKVIKTLFPGPGGDAVPSAESTDNEGQMRSAQPESHHIEAKPEECDSTKGQSEQQQSSTEMVTSQTSTEMASLNSTGQPAQEEPPVLNDKSGSGSARTEEDMKSLTALFVDVGSGSSGKSQQEELNEDDDNQDNDTDTAEESVDPYKNCEQNMLVHITKVHADIEKQLEALEQQMAELENSEHTNPTVQLSEDNILNDVPALKKSLSKLTRTLGKVQRLCIQH